MLDWIGLSFVLIVHYWLLFEFNSMKIQSRRHHQNMFLFIMFL